MTIAIDGSLSMRPRSNGATVIPIASLLFKNADQSSLKLGLIYSSPNKSISVSLLPVDSAAKRMRPSNSVIKLNKADKGCCLRASMVSVGAG